MSWRRTRWIGWLALGIVLASAASSEAAPWTRLFNKRVEADPEKNYVLSQDDGPWMIMAASFSGDGAEQQARDLVLELRSRFHVEAFIYDKIFDYSGGVDGKGLNRYGEQQRLQYRRGGRYREIAVLAGNFDEVDSPGAQKLLQELKYADVICMRIEEGKKDHRNLGLLREMQKQVNLMAGHGHAAKARRGPLGHAFITTNPLLPDEYFKPTSLSPFIVRLNEPFEFSLLKCPGKYTVKIATFTGAVVVDPKAIREIETENKFTGRLVDAADNANKLVVELRRRGVEAYEFHDYNMSIVTVGGFNTIGNPLPDGRTELLPGILQIMKEYGAEMVPTPAGPRMTQPKQIAKVSLDLQPQIVEVPRPRQVTAADRARWQAQR